MTAKDEIAAKLKALSDTIAKDDGNGEWAHDPALFKDIWELIEIHKIDMRRAKPVKVEVLGEPAPVEEAKVEEAKVEEAKEEPVKAEEVKEEPKHDEKHAKGHKVKNAKAGPATDENNNA